MLQQTISPPRPPVTIPCADRVLLHGHFWKAAPGRANGTSSSTRRPACLRDIMAATPPSSPRTALTSGPMIVAASGLRALPVARMRLSLARLGRTGLRCRATFRQGPRPGQSVPRRRPQHGRLPARSCRKRAGHPAYAHNRRTICLLAQLCAGMPPAPFPEMARRHAADHGVMRLFPGKAARLPGGFAVLRRPRMEFPPVEDGTQLSTL